MLENIIVLKIMILMIKSYFIRKPEYHREYVCRDENNGKKCTGPDVGQSVRMSSRKLLRKRGIIYLPTVDSSEDWYYIILASPDAGSYRHGGLANLHMIKF